MWRLLLLFAGACGRVGFGTIGAGDAGNDAAAGDATTPLSPCGPFDAGQRLAQSTAGPDHSPFLTADRLELYFHGPGRAGPGMDDILRVTRTDITQPFGAEQVVTELSSPLDEGGVSLSANGLTVYFSSNRGGSDDLYVATRPNRNTPFGTPAVLAQLSSSAGEFGPRVSPDHLTLIFASDRPGGMGGRDLYRATRTSAGIPFGSPVLMPAINSLFDEAGGVIGRGGYELFIGTSRADGGASHDIWVATRTDLSSEFGDPQPIVGPNTPGEGERPTSISTDGDEIYFHSARLEPGGDDLFVTTRDCP